MRGLHLSTDPARLGVPGIAAAGGGWSPRLMANLPLFQFAPDLASTLSITDAGTTIDQATDASGGSIVLVAPSAIRRVLYDTTHAINGHACAQIDAANHQLASATGAGLSAGASHTMAALLAVVTPPGGGQFGSAFTLGGNVSTLGCSASTWWGGGAGIGPPSGGTLVSGALTLIYKEVTAGSPGATWLWINGERVVLYGGTFGATTGIGLSPWNANGMLTTGRLYQALAWSGLLAHGVGSDKYRLEAWIAARWGLSTPIQVQFLGDSTTYGTGSTTPSTDSYPAQMLPLLTKSTAGSTNWGHPGFSIAGIATASLTEGDVHYTPIHVQDLACIVAGTNDLGAGTDGPTAYAALASLVAGRRAAGARKIIVGTLWPRIDFSGATETARLAYNALIRAMPAAGLVDAVVDFNTNPHLSNPADTTYFFDGLHLTTAGYAVVASMMAAAANAIL